MDPLAAAPAFPPYPYRMDRASEVSIGDVGKRGQKCWIDDVAICAECENDGDSECGERCHGCGVFPKSLRGAEGAFQQVLQPRARLAILKEAKSKLPHVLGFPLFGVRRRID